MVTVSVVYKISYLSCFIFQPKLIGAGGGGGEVAASGEKEKEHTGQRRWLPGLKCYTSMGP
jgi:hypothetical protein